MGKSARKLAPNASAAQRPAARIYRAATLAAGETALDAAAAHYLRDVLRLVPGQIVALFNAQDGEYAARISSFDKKGAHLVVEERLRAPEADGADIWLVFAPIKRAHLEYQVQKATELGARLLWPVYTQRTNVERVNEARLLAIATEAAEQSERLSVPAIRPPADLAAALAQWPSDRQILLCDETGGGQALGKFLAGQDLAKPWAILIGPEGGFAPDELALLRGKSFVRPVDLGPRVLRADTAALAALAVFQAFAPDADRRPNFQAI
ncbi:MAG: 16S rRNA (uracil(1498)-N(3))-methyltransferase [Telmatospirillum sp.]|nr:16S rRNA (uracil(1498)-N(3))-methyltransferase [Telmatospirillum sp.]